MALAASDQHPGVYGGCIARPDYHRECDDRSVQERYQTHDTPYSFGTVQCQPESTSTKNPRWVDPAVVGAITLVAVLGRLRPGARPPQLRVETGRSTNAC
jgi:hypothetical protein